MVSNGSHNEDESQLHNEDGSHFLTLIMRITETSYCISHVLGNDPHLSLWKFLNNLLCNHGSSYRTSFVDSYAYFG